MELQLFSGVCVYGCVCCLKVTGDLSLLLLLSGVNRSHRFVTNQKRYSSLLVCVHILFYGAIFHGTLLMGPPRTLGHQHCPSQHAAL